MLARLRQRLWYLWLALRKRWAWVSLSGLEEWQGREAWDLLAEDPDLAEAMSSGVMAPAGDSLAREAARLRAEEVREALALSPQDTVVDLGCGTGRLAEFLADHCRRWIGCDISSAMLAVARSRLAGRTQVDLLELEGSHLGALADGSVDKLYSLAVFTHIDESHRWAYAQEAFRVLRPGGVCYVDAHNLLGEEGWKVFLRSCQVRPELRPYIIRLATPQELARYFEQAGFQDVETRSGPRYVAVRSVKPGL